MISSSDHLHNDPTKTTATTTSNSSSYSPDKLSSDLAILVKAALLTRTRSGAEAQLNTAANITATSASSPNKASADILLEMEKTDEHFHKYSYIRHLQKKLSRTILPIIEKHLADDISTNDHQQQDLVLPLIVEKIMSTSEYKDLVNDQVEEARSCALDLINARKTMTSQSNSNTNNVAAGKSSDGGTLTAKDYYQQPQFIRLDDIFNPQEVNIVNDNSTSNTSAASPLLQHPHHQSTEASIICNTTNGGGAPISASSQRMMMPGTPSSAATTADETLSSISTSSNFFDDAAPLPGFNEIASMIATIHPSPASTSSSSVAGGSIAATSNTQEARLAAMHKFMSFSSSDLVCAELWPQTRRVMEVALGDSDCRIMSSGLLLAARIFRFAPPNMTGEVYLTLAMHLINMSESATATNLPLDLNLEDQKTTILLKKQYKDVMQSTFRLIKLGSASSKRSPNSLTALHLLAAVDPRCSWFSKWTLSNVGKTQTVAAIQKLDLMPDLVGYIMDFLLQISLGVLDRRGYSDVIVEDYEEMNDPDHIEHHHHDADNMIASHVLNYIHFIHAVTIMAKLVQFSAGRLCFPVKLTNERHKASLNRLLECERKDNLLTLDEFIQLLVMMACHDLSSVPSNASSTKSNLYKTVAENKYYNINSLACRLFKEIASSDSKTRSVLYSGMVANKLIKSIISMLHGSLETREGGVGGSGGGKGAESMETPNNVADLLSHIVSGESGRAFIMTHQIQLSINDSIQEPSHSIIQEINGSIIPCIIAQFVKRNLEEGMTTVRSCSLETLGYYIYFLRQIYGTCGGLLLLQQYELHNVLVEGDSLKQAALRDAMIFQDQYAWNKLVLDNLLRFASTPKGVDLLYKSGSMESCISYMFNERYSKGLQMSKCEKFGYGALVSQVSVTSPGMQALYNSKLIKSLFEDLKTLLELQNSPCANISVADNTHTTTGPHSISKTLSNIFKVISSFNGLRTIVENDMVLLNPVYKELGAKRSTPDSKLLRSGWEFTFGGFIYKFALMDRRFLLRLESSFEESRLICMKMLSLACTSLDSLLLMQQRFNFQNILIYQLIEKSRSMGSQLVIDESLSLALNLLLSSFSIGGPSERILLNPTTQLEENGGLMLSEILSLMTRPSALISSNVVVGEEWIGEEIGESTLLSGQRYRLKDTTGKLKLCVLANLLHETVDKMTLSSYHQKANNYSRDSTVNIIELNEVDELAIELIARYACRIRVQQSNNDDEKTILSMTKDDLKKIILHTKRWINSNNSSSSSSAQTSCPNDSFTGFDWFASVIYIIMGSANSTISFLDAFAKCSVSEYLWPRGPLALSSSATITTSTTTAEFNPIMASLATATAIPKIYSVSSHLIETIIESELPTILSSFTLSGCTLSQITERWLRECFLGELDFKDVATYIHLCCVYGVEYQIYFCVAVLKELQEGIRTAAREGNLLTFLNEFKMTSSTTTTMEMDSEVCLDYMRALDERYGDIVRKEMR